MSFCRFSTNGFRCDLYVYEDARGGVTIHVAGRRKVGWWPSDWDILLIQDGPLRMPYLRLWMWWHRLSMKIYSLMPWRDLPEPYAGASYYSLDYDEAAEQVELLMAAGFRCPKDLPTWIREVPVAEREVQVIKP